MQLWPRNQNVRVRKRTSSIPYLQWGLGMAFLTVFTSCASPKPGSPDTEIFSLAARYYLLFAAPTTQSIVAVSLPADKTRDFVAGESDLTVVRNLLVFWPGKDPDDEELEKCRTIFLEAYDEVTDHIAAGLDRDWCVYELCENRMSAPDPCFQYLTLNMRLLEELRKGFPTGPPPLGVHIVTEVTGWVTFY